MRVASFEATDVFWALLVVPKADSYCDSKLVWSHIKLYAAHASVQCWLVVERTHPLPPDRSSFYPKLITRIEGDEWGARKSLVVQLEPLLMTFSLAFASMQEARSGMV